MARKSGIILPIIVGIALVLCAMAGIGVYYYLQCKTPDYTITFDDSKQLETGAPVLLSGMDIGKVVSIKPGGTGVFVGIRIDDEYEPGLTESSKFFIDTTDGKSCLLVKNLSATAKPLVLGQVVEGTDSSWMWAAYDVAKGVNSFLASDRIRVIRETIRSYNSEIERQLKEMNWGEIGQDLQRQMDEISKEVAEALKSKDVQKIRADLEKSFNHALATLDKVQNSKEAEELRKSIEKYYSALQEELSKPATPPQKS